MFSAANGQRDMRVDLHMEVLQQQLAPHLLAAAQISTISFCSIGCQEGQSYLLGGQLRSSTLSILSRQAFSRLHATGQLICPLKTPHLCICMRPASVNFCLQMVRRTHCWVCCNWRGWCKHWSSSCRASGWSGSCRASRIAGCWRLCGGTSWSTWALGRRRSGGSSCWATWSWCWRQSRWYWCWRQSSWAWSSGRRYDHSSWHNLTRRQCWAWWCLQEKLRILSSAIPSAWTCIVSAVWSNPKFRPLYLYVYAFWSQAPRRMSWSPSNWPVPNWRKTVRGMRQA